MQEQPCFRDIESRQLHRVGNGVALGKLDIWSAGGRFSPIIACLV
jgi:hypothetical protein